MTDKGAGPFRAETRPEPGGSWLDRPQARPLRRAVFQLHMWLALSLGVYIVVISVSGSAVVFRGELGRWLVPQRVEVAGERLAGDALAAAVERAYADDRVLRIGRPGRADRPVAVVIERDGVEQGRLFDPYAAADLGESFPRSMRVLEWLVALHDDLLAGYTGRKVNGIAGALVVLLVLSGAVIWWPGRTRWRRSLYATRTMRRPLWHLHGAIGFWTFLLLFNWALTGVYMAFPGPVESLIDRLDPDPNDLVRPGEGLVRFLVTAHFGRFGGLEVRIAWTLLGLLPAVLFVTGFMLWWRRVLRPRMDRAGPTVGAAGSAPPAGLEP